MKIIDKNLLLEFRLKPKCEACGKRVQECDPHHIMTRGAGRVDIRCNLISLCVECHTGFHTSGKPSFFALLEIAAHREGTTPDEVLMKVWEIRRDTSMREKVIS